jgi:MoxR-like ATPase
VTTFTGARPHPDPSAAEDWRIYRGGGQQYDAIERLPPPPPWRPFETDDSSLIEPIFPAYDPATDRARGYQVTDDAIEMVNAAMYLRRPLLVTGKPGTGKSTLAYSIASELVLGPVLYWPITSRSRLADGLYRYDALGRLHESNLGRAGGPSDDLATDVGRYITLGPLGTALLPQRRPRVVLVDELDKSDIDLPNDLLNVFEEGRFEIPELVRLPPEQSTVSVMTADSTVPVPVQRGLIQCYTFPIVVITSNAEREFPPAFLRRCLRLDIRPPDERMLTRIVVELLGESAAAETGELIRQFLKQRDRGDLVATDQLLNAIYLVTSGIRPPESAQARLRANLIRDLSANSLQ